MALSLPAAVVATEKEAQRMKEIEQLRLNLQMKHDCEVLQKEIEDFGEPETFTN